MSKQIHSSCSAEDPGWQHSGDNTKDQLRPVSQTISVAGAVCMDQEPTLHSSAIAFAGEMPERGGAQSLKYCTTQLPQLIGSIDLFDTMWIYEAASLVWEYQSVAQNKQTEIQLDNPVIPRWASSQRRCHGGGKKGRNKHIVKFFFCYLGPAVTHSTTHQKGRMKLAMHCQISLLKQTNWLLAHKKKECDTTKHNCTFIKHHKFLKFAQEKIKSKWLHTASLSGLHSILLSSWILVTQRSFP